MSTCLLVLQYDHDLLAHLTTELHALDFASQRLSTQLQPGFHIEVFTIDFY
jgi:hypothetical protein